MISLLHFGTMTKLTGDDGVNPNLVPTSKVTFGGG
jgi:hypothetical protein